MLNPCVRETAEGFLSLGAVGEVTVDKRAVLTSGYLLGTGTDFDDESYVSFIRRFEQRGFVVQQEGSLIRICKKLDQKKI